MYSSNLFAISIQIYIINKYNLNHLLLFDVRKCSFIERKRVSDWSLLVLHAFLGLQDDVAECVLCCVLNIKTRIVVSSNASHLVCRILLRYMFSHISTGKYTLCDKFLRSPMCGDFLLGYIWFVRLILNEYVCVCVFSLNTHTSQLFTTCVIAVGHMRECVLSATILSRFRQISVWFGEVYVEPNLFSD